MKTEQDEMPRSKPHTFMKRIVVRDAVTFTQKKTVDAAMLHYAGKDVA